MNAASLAPILRFVLSERGWPPSTAIDRLAARFPAIAAAGIEFALTERSRVDIQQMLRTREDAQRLLAFCNAADSRLGSQLDPMRIHDLLAGGAADEVWLEMDDEGQGENETPPLSIFVRIGRGAGGSDIERVLRLLATAGTTPPTPQRQALERAVSALPDGAFLSHAGIMAGRTGSPLRLIVDGIPCDGLRSYLERTHWPGRMAEALACADGLATCSDRIRLALTLDAALRPEIGFECFVGTPGPAEPRWRGLLAVLAADGLADTETSDAVLAWPAVITPRTAEQPWPERLIIDDLLRGKHQAGWIECRISHVKVTLGADGPPRAKAYVGFLEVTNRTVPSRIAPEPAAPLPARISTTTQTRSLQQACDAAIRFLLDARTQTGWWLDYDGFAEGTSDEWVTAYVGHALAGTDGAGRAAAGLAWALLSGRSRSRPGWGWNHAEPADADSTAWAVRLAQRLGQADTSAASAGTAFLHAHIDDTGGVTTYRRAQHGEWSGDRAVNAGWFASHACVTAAAAGLTALRPRLRGYLETAQGDDGAWDGYWWADRAYATALAADALREDAPEAARRAARWAAARLDAGSATRLAAHQDPFGTALALRTALPAVRRPDDLAAALNDLLAAQRVDGSWTGSAHLRIPNARDAVVPACDNRATFTTATVLETLTVLRQAAVSA
ncbi:hypothetical protein ABIE65_003227 [Constrictibacter sp. MBR-5]|uniref:hypothetical protein n=1 Tax=Constrictibacter sp. MBR-5 TaxID=3156467 RepID=UPI00339B7865